MEIVEVGLDFDRKKKERGRTFSRHEVKIFLSLLEKHKKIIESKDVDGLTWKAKAKAWENITEEYNSKMNGKNRTVTQLQNKWHAMKKVAKHKLKKDHAKQLNSFFESGDEYSPFTTDSFSEKVQQLCNNISISEIAKDFETDDSSEDCTHEEDDAKKKIKKSCENYDNLSDSRKELLVLQKMYLKSLISSQEKEDKIKEEKHQWEKRKYEREEEEHRLKLKLMKEEHEWKRRQEDENYRLRVGLMHDETPLRKDLDIEISDPLEDS